MRSLPLRNAFFVCLEMRLLSANKCVFCLLRNASFVYPQLNCPKWSSNSNETFATPESLTYICKYACMEFVCPYESDPFCQVDSGDERGEINCRIECRQEPPPTVHTGYLHTLEWRLAQHRALNRTPVKGIVFKTKEGF